MDAALGAGFPGGLSDRLGWRHPDQLLVNVVGQLVTPDVRSDGFTDHFNLLQ